ncbi:hypothetical protein [Nocardioides mesophilus]|uniref:Uncharacterized protein n=1 Tax=Nocardioides mesophilus TaxID=433659 RepID=A0A7G9RDI2_9ACTN|nr:hypothetical protein [Nocardioides mesophilus]QNN53657.1 hypothetical protein H9L09_04335 [Nocardioides mesophilus]
MNEKDVTDLLQRATRELSPDVHTMVAYGLRRGRVRQRRRRAVAAGAASAAAVLVTVGGVQLLGSAGPAPRPIAPADSATPSVPSPAPSRAAKARLAVATEQVPTTFASIAPGEVSPPSAKSGPDSAPVVDFTWRGFGIRVGLTPDDYVTGRSIPDPARRCAEQGDGSVCRPGPDGTVVSTSSFTNPAVDGGTQVRSVTVFRPDGWDVLVMAYNGPGKEGPVTADAPPLGLPQLQRIASSDVWFR